MKRIKRSASTWTLWIGLLLAGSTSSAEVINYGERIERLKQVAAQDFKADLPTRQAADNITRAYLDLFGQVDLPSVEDQPEVLKSLFDAADLASFYTNSVDYARQMHQYFDLLKVTGDLDVSRGVKVHQAYLGAEDFTAAEQFAAAHAYLNLRPLPAVAAQQTASGLQEWIISADGNVLTASPFALPPGPYLMVAASIRCHFSLNSMRALQNFPDVGRLSGRSKWLMRIERSINFTETAKWNKAHAAFAFSIPRHYAAWADITHWDTPTFYFFNNGKLVYNFSGWPAQGNLEKVKQGMREAGFYDLDHSPHH